ncbi:MAG: KTSC domain-containing protein [Bryobacteraceae bacterium]
MRAVLELEFRDRRTHQYFAVPAEVHDALLRAPAKGNYFNRMIRAQFVHAR